MKWRNNFKFQLGKTSGLQLRIGSWVGIVTVLICAGANTLGRLLGTPDALWVKIVGWVSLAIFSGDIAESLLKLSTRKMWETVMLFSLTVGGTLVIASIVLYIKGEEIWLRMGVMGVLIALILGGLGFVMWRRALRRLNSLILERKLKRKKRNV